MPEPSLPRRALLSGAALGALALALPRRAAAGRPAGADGFAYEMTRTEEEWRARLTEAEFRILRLGDTELPETSPNWNRDEPGRYACRGCDLPLYRSEWKRDVGIGWAFFQFGEPNAMLMGIDAFGGMTEGAPLDMIEAHCRRCGSHLGHIVQVEGIVLHCINGQALGFEPAEA